jgi:Bax protein
MSSRLQRKRARRLKGIAAVAMVLAMGGIVAAAGGWSSALSYPAAEHAAPGDSFDSRAYSANLAAKEGRAVPRVLAASMPGDLADASPTERKQRFVELVLPLILAVNEEIAADRAQLVALGVHVVDGEAVTPEQADWLSAVARHYEVPLTGDAAADIADLLNRVDAVPPSLALAQAALESGWGTSRFALEGNALFGERTWGKGGLMEIGAGEETAHRARSFDRLLDGVTAYMQNLNSHPAYAEFRRARAELRDEGQLPTGVALVAHLTSYSERGNAYVRAVRNLIRANDFGAHDGAILTSERDAT